MINEQQQDQASLFVLGGLSEQERDAFEMELRHNVELRQFVQGLERAAGLMAAASPPVPLPAGIKDRIFRQIELSEHPATPSAASIPPLAGLRFLAAAESTGWKPLPISGAWIKLLSLERERGYAVLLGKLDPGVRFPAHVNAGPEDFYILSGDLRVNQQVLRAGDFHHADAGSLHGENYSAEGCTLLAVLTTDDPLVAFAQA